MTTLFKADTGKIKPRVFSGMLDPFFKKEWGEWFDKSYMDTIPSVNISETPKSYHVEMAAPGLKKEDFKINIQGDMITISSEKESETKTEEKEFSRREYNYNSFSRSFSLPEFVDQEKIAATYSEGILKLDLPKKDVVKTADTKNIKVS
ncbi:MAG: Hsp20/alpha crystallin family protein [Bacteroidia bacterium]|nr:Hsp20/alpha crystallin family protein [Bacteroidia bacterium]